MFHYDFQTLDVTIEGLPRDRNGKLPKENLRNALDLLGSAAALPPLGAVEKVLLVYNK